MASREPLPLQATPYSWDDKDDAPPSTEILQLWTEVGNGIDKNQTVVWKSAVESLDHANNFLRTSQDARIFVEKYMGPIIGILVEQQPQKIGPHERNCVQDSLKLAVTIVSRDLEIQIERKGECNVLDVLSLVFNKKKAYYKGNKGNWNVNHLVGLPEVRLRMIDKFREEMGFANLNQYLLERINTPLFPRLGSLHHVLQAIGDAIPNRGPSTLAAAADGGAAAGVAALGTAPGAVVGAVAGAAPVPGTAGSSASAVSATRQMEDDAIAVAKAVMEYIKEVNDEALKKLPPDQLSTVQQDLQRIFDRLISSRRQSTYQFYEFWRGLILKLITSQSLPLKLFGWEQMNEIIEASADHAPPPRTFIVRGAGCTFVNGPYHFAGEITEDGYLQRGADISYERRIPEGEEGAGKKLTLFRCTMRSQQKWWFLSEADEEQPGTDRDIDYYQHKSKEHEETEPPAAGWSTCRNAGLDPPPLLKSSCLLVPPGEEYNTLEHQLARWAIDNQIIEQVLGDSVHREVVARSTALIKFLASMCEKYNIPDLPTGQQPTKYCLRTSHLLLAWKTCTRKADAAVSAQVYQLLVSILPACPSSLAIPLLQAVHASLVESNEKRDYLLEVAEFCAALATANSVDAKPTPSTMLSDDVREEVLKLLWAVLTHPDASTLKSYDNLKRYVTNELRVEPKGSEHRESFLRSCINALSASERQRQGATVDEIQALRMVKLTRFILEACPRDQAHKIVVADSGALPILLFNELTAHLERRKTAGNGTSAVVSTAVRRIPSRNDLEVKQQPVVVALQERLRILRYVYGLSDHIQISSEYLHILWRLCSLPFDREELMVFIASASSNGLTKSDGNFIVEPAQNNVTVPADEMLSAAFSEEVCTEVFLDLFCSPTLSYDHLGHGAYKSFQFMFDRFRTTPGTSYASSSVALDALWRICLTSGNTSVASQAMKDLLNVYVFMGSADQTADNNAWTVNKNKTESTVSPMVAESNLKSFGERVFDCLTSVKKGLDEGQPGAERSAERCLRILNAAIGQTITSGTGSSMTFSTLARLSSVSLDCTLSKINKILPHGMRGQACYRRVGITTKRTWIHNQSGQSSHVYATREDASAPGSSPGANPSKNSSTLRFPLDVHPLETLASVKQKVASFCHCSVGSVKPVSVSGRLVGGSNRSPGGESPISLNVYPDDSVIDDLGIVQGSELVFHLVDRQLPNNAGNATNKVSKYNRHRDLSDIFFDDDGHFTDKLFLTLLGVLEKLPWREPDVLMSDDAIPVDVDTHKLVWDLLLAMPTDISVATRVRSISSAADNSSSIVSDDDAMEVDSSRELWPNLLDLNSFHRSVYVLLAIDAFLQPAVEVLSILPSQQRSVLEREMQEESLTFRRDFIESGGFDAVVRFFSASEGDHTLVQSRTRIGNAVALRILTCCLFGNTRATRTPQSATSSATVPDEVGARLLQSLLDAEGLLRSLTAMVVGDEGISTSTISDVLKFLRLLFRTSRTAQSFVSLPDGTAEQFLITLLMWEGGPEATRTSATIGAAAKIRKNTHDLILETPLLADHSLPWLIRAIDRIEVTSDCTSEYFDVLQKLVADERSTARSRNASETELRELGTTVCKKVASCPRPTNETALIDFSTGVLCGCLALLRALIETGGGNVLRPGTNILVTELGVTRWSEMVGTPGKGVLAALSSSFRSGQRVEDIALIDLMGAIFDGFLSPGGSSSVVAICCDKESRQRGFDVVGAAARSCRGGDGYMALVRRVNGLVSSASPYVRHRWGQVGTVVEGHSRTNRNSSKYSGLRNQGCTCYMNSFLQQMFMMPELRKSMCAAPLPASLRSTGGVISAKGVELVGKKLSMQWESGVSYDAIVEAFDSETGMHTIRYCPFHIATVSGGSAHDQIQPEDIARLPPPLPDEFFLSEGRPGKETGVFEIVSTVIGNTGESTSEILVNSTSQGGDNIQENEDEISSRHLLEEVQRTFIHLDEGSRGRCFDPRALVEACACLKLEFDVWQQNDASEFATKLLDRVEIALKKWAPSCFRYLDHTFGLKQTKQKICKECGLKTNREEKLMNIDCQIRGKADIHEALSTMTEVEIMEGNNKVFCDRCKKNTDTILRTAISSLPNMLILSLKRFDLDYNTFETVKLNSRCAFGQTLNMKRYTLEGVEAMEQPGYNTDASDPSPMDTTGDVPVVNDPLSQLPDDDYEYKLAGVLVHAGVAQGGHYYSFIKDRNRGAQDQWFRFDDEDVTPFDPASIEVECFGGKVKKEAKWPNGQVHTVESEQYANALMLFYEKVKPSDVPDESKDSTLESNNVAKVVETADGYVIYETFDKASQSKKLTRIETSSGYDVFEPDVRRSNATHRWQTFLFHTEFQIFLKGLLGLCRLSTGDRSDSGEPWRASVVQMLLAFVFDILLYSSERPSLNEWVRMFEETFAVDRYSARAFVHKLARKTVEVSGNWLRTYLSDCSDQMARIAAVRIFSAAVRSCASSDEEQRILGDWSQEWKGQLATFAQPPPSALPCSLEGSRKSLEDIQAIEGGGASSLGVIISFLNVLLEATPRVWRYSPELSLFIRNLGNISTEAGGDVLRTAMVQAMIPARLMSLVIRERAPLPMRVAFPGASVAVEVAETQMRAESNPVAHVMPIGGNHVMNPSDLNSRGNGTPVPGDFLALFEAIGCMAGLRGVTHATLVLETDETSRGRHRATLSKAAVNALTIVFQESCAPNSLGMGQSEIEMYLQRCGVDSASVPTQKIVDIMAKYPTTTGGNGTKGASYLSLEGFLAYYRDTAQTAEARVRADLHTFGFRPDLSRRPRIEKDQPLSTAESVASDIASQLENQGEISLGPMSEYGLDSFHLFAVAWSASEPLCEILLSGTAYGRNTDNLISSTLKAIYQAPSGWNGNEPLSAAVTVLRVLASVPDDKQQHRISLIMQCNDKPAHNVEHGAGLLSAASAFYGSRPTQHYSSDIHYAYDRYVSILKELLSLHAVYKWMYDNGPKWNWMERDLLESHPAVPQHNQMRGNYSATRDVESSAVPVDHHHSDSDMNGINDSEDDDDDDSRFEEGMDTFQDVPPQLIVEGAGQPAVNGVYSRDGYFESACKYTMSGKYKDESCHFSLFQCSVSNNTKHWYISIVPRGSQPGTSTDIDFYSAPVTETCTDFPPLNGWTKSNEGRDPPPKIFKEHRVPEGEPHGNVGQVWNNVDGEEEENHGGHTYI